MTVRDVALAAAPDDFSAGSAREVRFVREGDAGAFSRLYASLSPRVRRTAYRLIGDVHETEDAVQDAFFDAYRNLPKLQDPRAFEAWLMQIARHRAVDRRREL